MFKNAMESKSNIKRGPHHLEKKPAKRKSKDISAHSQESSNIRERPVKESSKAQNQAELLARKSPIVKECSVIVQKLSLEDIKRTICETKQTRSYVESVPQYASNQTSTTHSNEHLDSSDGTKLQDLGSYKDPETSSPALPIEATTSNHCNTIVLDLDEEEILLTFSFPSSSEDSDEECTEVNKKKQSSPDYYLVGENKKVVDTPTTVGTNVQKESFSRDKSINVNSNRNDSKDLAPKIKGPLDVNRPSVLYHSTKDADVSEKFHKPSHSQMESLSKRNPFSDTNKDTASKTTPKGSKPKLTKQLLLRKPIVLKSIKNNPVFRQNHDNNLERIVDCSETKQGIKSMKITKIFSDPGKEKEICAAKNNLQHIYNLKPSDTFSTFHKDTKDNTEKNMKSFFSVKPIPLVKRKFEDVHQKNGEDQNGSVKRLHHLEDNNIEGKSVSVEPLSRHTYLRDEQAINASSSSTNVHLNQTSLPSNDFVFVTPTELPNQRLIQTTTNDDDYDDDDNETLVSFFASDDLISDIDNYGKEPNRHKRTWNKFEREGLDCNDNNGDNQSSDEEESTYKVSSRQFTQKKSNLEVAYPNQKEVNEERGHTHSCDLTRNEKFKLSNVTRKNSTANCGRTSSYSLPICDPQTKFDPQYIIKGHCLLYLRLSIESHDDCNLIHQVPRHLFLAEGVEGEEQIVSTINYIIKTNFKNPPEDLVHAIVSFCVQCDQSHLQGRISILVSLGNALRGVKMDKAEQLWCTFLETISRYLISPSFKKSLHISRVLQGIFGNQLLDSRSEDCEVFKLIQKALIHVHRICKPEIQLLTCIGFMCEKASRRRLDVKLISPEFALSIVKQCLDEIKILPLTVWKKFAYKVVFNLISDHNFGYVKNFLCFRDKSLVSQFIEIVQSNKVTDPAHLSRIKQLISTNEIEEPSLEQRRESESRQKIKSPFKFKI